MIKFLKPKKQKKTIIQKNINYIECGFSNSNTLESKYILYPGRHNIVDIISQSSNHPIIIIFCGGDNTINYINNLPPWVYKFYGTNLNVSPSEIFQAIPFGLLSGQIEEIKKLDHKILIREFNPKVYKKYLVYANFNTDTYAPRNRIHNDIINKNFIYNKIHNFNKRCLSQQDYYNDILNSKFVICPRGNGIDTYRMWEVLYLRSFPIVEKSHFTSHFAQDLPILEIEKQDFDKLNETFLEEQYNIMINKQWNYQLLDRQYWINKWNKDIILLQEEAKYNEFRNRSTAHRIFSDIFLRNPRDKQANKTGV